MDRLTTQHRSALMARVRGKNTAPEIQVRSLLHRLGYRFTLHNANLPGKPDIVLPRHLKTIFVNGCLWHGHEGCKKAKAPASNVAFWQAKIGRNKERDLEVSKSLRERGWSVLVVWECTIKNGTAMNLIQKYMNNKEI